MSDEHKMIQDQFAALHAGTLTNEQENTIFSHLETCAICEQRYAEFEQGSQVTSLQSLKASAPASLDKEVAQKINRRSGGRFFAGNRQPTFFRWIPSQLLAVLFLLLAVWLAYNASRSNTSSPQHTPKPLPSADMPIAPALPAAN